jgi:flagellar hook-associated protein 3 FlgL
MISITPNRMTRDIQRQSNLATALARTQTDISTGRKLQQPSDDPGASARLASIRQSQSNIDAWQSNLQLGISLSDQADAVLSAVTDRMAHARELVIAAASATVSPVDRETMASELRSLADELSSLANSKSSLGNDLFSTGPALKFRFDEGEVLEPVPSRQDAFEINGVTLAQIASNAADSLFGGSATQINQALNSLEGGINKAANTAANIGVSGNRMANIRERHVDERLVLTIERSGLEDTDLNEAIARLQQQSVTLDAARAAFARINRQTLFDLLS